MKFDSGRERVRRMIGQNLDKSKIRYWRKIVSFLAAQNFNVHV